MCVSCQNIYQDINNFSALEENDTELIRGSLDSISNPLVSIIITVYKRKEYIHEAINSALDQKNIDFNYEILIFCDDPQTDISEFNKYNNIKNILIYRNRRNLGLYNSTNLGVKVAQGKYVAFLHDDDILYPQYLSEVYKFLNKKKQNAKCVLINRDVLSLSTKKPVKILIKFILKFFLFPFFLLRVFFKKFYKKITLKEGLTYILSNLYKAPSCGTLFDKKAFLASGGFNQNFWPVSDYYFFLKFNKDNPVYILRKKLACYRWFDNLSQNKTVQYTGFEHLYVFFKSAQPVNSVNRYYSFFHNEVLYAKFIMINKEYRSEIIDKYPELKHHNKTKWFIFKLYNFVFRFYHDLVI
ncbi:MAG: glycosyltransferase family 2 protein [Treponema sp.]|nr:glycosyltransferase family 2 protein [Treponema sp.]